MQENVILSVSKGFYKELRESQMPKWAIYLESKGIIVCDDVFFD